MKINTNTRRDVKRNKTHDRSVIVLNIPKGSLVSQKPNPVNNGLDAKRAMVDFLAEIEGQEKKKTKGGVGVNCLPKTGDINGEK